MIRTKHSAVEDRLMRLAIYAAQLDLPFSSITFSEEIVSELRAVLGSKLERRFVGGGFKEFEFDVIDASSTLSETSGGPMSDPNQTSDHSG